MVAQLKEMMALFLSVWLAAASTVTYAQSNSRPTVQNWAKEWISSKSKNNSSYPMKILVLETPSSDGVPKVKKLNRESFNQKGTYEIINDSDLMWAYQVNAPLLKKNADSAPESWLPIFSGTRFVLIADSNAPTWELQEVVAGKLNTIVQAAKTKDDEANIHEWITQNQKYQGIVLDAKGQFILVGAPRYTLTNKGIQGVIFEEMNIGGDPKSNSKKSQALLSLVESWENFGVFKILYKGAGVVEIKANSKVLIQRPPK